MPLLKILAFCLLTLGVGACSDKLLHPRYYDYANAPLREVVAREAATGKIGPYPLFVFAGRPLKGKQINETLSNLRQEEITDIAVSGKAEAKKAFGKIGRQGAVRITPITDKQLSPDYYDFVNPFLNGFVGEFQKRGLVQEYPVYVVDGQALRGDAIRERLSELQEEDIKAVEVLKQARAYQVYGASAKDGVVLITTNEGKREQKE